MNGLHCNFNIYAPFARNHPSNSNKLQKLLISHLVDHKKFLSLVGIILYVSKYQTSQALFFLPITCYCHVTENLRLFKCSRKNNLGQILYKQERHNNPQVILTFKRFTVLRPEGRTLLFCFSDISITSKIPSCITNF